MPPLSPIVFSGQMVNPCLKFQIICTNWVSVRVCNMCYVAMDLRCFSRRHDLILKKILMTFFQEQLE